MLACAIFAVVSTGAWVPWGLDTATGSTGPLTWAQAARNYAWDDWDIGASWSAGALRADDEFYADGEFKTEDDFYAEDDVYADDDGDRGSSSLTPTRANALLTADEVYTERNQDTGDPWSALLSDAELIVEGDWLMGRTTAEGGADPTAAGRQGAGAIWGHDTVSIDITPTADRSGPLDAGVQLSARGALGGEQVQRDIEFALALAAATVTWLSTWAGAEAVVVVDRPPEPPGPPVWRRARSPVPPVRPGPRAVPHCAARRALAAVPGRAIGSGHHAHAGAPLGPRL